MTHNQLVTRAGCSVAWPSIKQAVHPIVGDVDLAECLDSKYPSSVYRFLTSGGPCIAKTEPLNRRSEASILRAVSQLTGVNVPVVLGTVRLESPQARVIVMKEMQGTPARLALLGLAPHAVSSVGSSAARVLRTINARRFPQYGHYDASGAVPIPLLRHRHGLSFYCEDALTRIADAPSQVTLTRGDVSRLRRLMREALGQLLTLPEQPPVLIHGDFSPDNIIVGIPSPTHEFISGVIDWEYSKSYEAAFDPCRFLIGTHLQQDLVKPFWKEYVVGEPDAYVALVACFIVVELVLHLNWACRQARHPQPETLTFINSFHSMRSILEWLDTLRS